MGACGIQNRQRLFFIRGPYPVYMLSSLFLMTYFYFYMPEDFQESWGTIYYSTFFAKVFVTFILAFIEPSFVIKDDVMIVYGYVMIE